MNFNLIYFFYFEKICAKWSMIKVLFKQDKDGFLLQQMSNVSSQHNDLSKHEKKLNLINFQMPVFYIFNHSLEISSHSLNLFRYFNYHYYYYYLNDCYARSKHKFIFYFVIALTHCTYVTLIIVFVKFKINSFFQKNKWRLISNLYVFKSK